MSYGGYPGDQGGYPQGGAGFGGQVGAGGSAAAIKRPFFIVSAMDGKVVDIKGAHAKAGTELCAYNKNNPPAPNQLWYEDEQGFIRSMLNDMTFANTEVGHQLKTEPGMGNPRAMWRFEPCAIHNQAGEALDIKGQSTWNDASLISYQSKPGQKNQLWRREYI